MIKSFNEIILEFLFKCLNFSYHFFWCPISELLNYLLKKLLCFARPAVKYNFFHYSQFYRYYNIFLFSSSWLNDKHSPLFFLLFVFNKTKEKQILRGIFCSFYYFLYFVFIPIILLIIIAYFSISSDVNMPWETIWKLSVQSSMFIVVVL